MNTRCSESLFRKQAVKALSKKPYGRPISVVPRPWTWLTGLVVAFAAIATLFLTTAEYSRKESVRGWLVASNGVARIAYNSTGIVERINATPGKSVNAGDPLFYLSRNIFLENGRSSGDELTNELRKQSAAIDRQTHLLRAKAEIERNSIARQLEDLEKEQNAMSQRQVEQQRRLHSASNKLMRLESAARGGAVTEFEVLRQQDEQAVLRQTSGQMKQTEISLKRERERLMALAESLPIETERLISDLNAQQSKLKQQITQYQSEGRVVLKSPIAGKLASIEVHPGSAVAPNQLLATVVPENLTLAAEVYVPSSAVGFIKRGQSVRLMYDAFPVRKFGAFAGRVDYISDFVLLPSEVPQTFFLREATFKIRISIERENVALETGSAPLKPGMLLVAEIILESRSLVDWLFEPIRLRHRVAA